MDLKLVEGGPPVVTALDLPVVQSLTEAKVVTAAPAGPGRWELRTASKVGVARIGGVTVWIKPKVSVARLLWLLGYAKGAVFEAPGPVGLAESAGLVPVIAEAFCQVTERSLQQGLLQGYREVDATDMVLRGRLRTTDQLRKRYGLAVPLLVRFDDYLIDIPENQILLAATNRLLRLPGVNQRIRTRIRIIKSHLGDVSDLPAHRPLPAWRPTRLNSRYHTSLHLAETILAGASVEQRPGTVRLDGFLVDLFKVFEDFVTTALGAALTSRSGTCTSQDRFSLDEDRRIDIRPDLVWRIGGTTAAVIDAKYKAEKPAGFPQADIYQALAYAIAYRLSEVHLIYARGNEEATSWIVRHAGIRVIAHALDLAQPVKSVLAQIDTIALRIAKGTPGTTDAQEQR